MGTATIILTIIQAALAGLGQVQGATAADAALASEFLGIFQAGQRAFQAATGQPLDITKIPLETPAV